MKFRSRIIPTCCTVIIAALYVVGFVSGTELRHLVQTLPLWLGAILGYLGAHMARWVALPLFLIWLFLMILIWLFLLGWANLIQGHFSPTEIAMTLIVGMASLVGIIKAASVRSGVGAWPAAATALLTAVLQLVAFRLSELPMIAHR